MPKLYTDEPDKFWKVGDKEYRIDKENSDCVYSDEEHVYINKKDNSRYISVTTLINKYSEEFDEEFWSSYKALEEIMVIHSLYLKRLYLLLKNLILKY